MSSRSRFFFGALAFFVSIIVIAYTLSAYVPDSKEQIALVVLGNVLGWPLIVLQFFYGSSEGSKEKTAMMATRPTGEAGDPVHVEEEL